MKIVNFGEMLLRLNPPRYLRLVQTDTFEASYGGSEANVALSLACFGDDSRYITKLPDHEIGQSALNQMRRYGVDMSMAARGGQRLGIYFAEKGASMRVSQVVYDRAASSFAESTADDYDWPGIFADADWFHFSGITPALGGELPKICMDACKTAKKMGLTVSCDLNYRGKLWNTEQADPVMAELMPYVDLIVTSESDAKGIFGIKAPGEILKDETYVPEMAMEFVEKFLRRFGEKKIAVMLRTAYSADDYCWGDVFYSDGKYYYGPTMPIHAVDIVGSGDAYCAAMIHALRQGKDAQYAADFANGAAALKHTIEFDGNLVTEKDVFTALKSKLGEGVQR